MNKQVKRQRRHANYLGKVLVALQRKHLIDVLSKIRCHANTFNKTATEEGEQQYVSRQYRGDDERAKQFITRPERETIQRRIRHIYQNQEELDDDETPFQKLLAKQKNSQQSLDKESPQAKLLRKYVLRMFRGTCQSAFEKWRGDRSGYVDMSATRAFEISGTNDELEHLRTENELMRYKVDRLKSTLQSTNEEFQDFEVTSVQELEREEETAHDQMVRLRWKGMCAIFAEKHLRAGLSAFICNAKFAKSKAALLERMPLPRRKKWWEKLAEHQHDHFYREGSELLPSVPPNFYPVYKIVIEHRLMHHILKIQRFIKKRGLERWLIEQNPKNRDWQNKFLVNVNKVDTTGENGSGGEVACHIF